MLHKYKANFNRLLQSFINTRFNSIPMRPGQKHTILLQEGSRLDFQGNTAAGDYNFQIQVDTKSFGAVLMNKNIVHELNKYTQATELASRQKYVARQIAGAMIESYRVGTMFMIEI